MRTFAAILAEDRFGEAFFHEMAGRGSRVLPFHPAIEQSEVWVDSEGRTGLIAWSNEGMGHLLGKGDKRAVAFSGMLHQGGVRIDAEALLKRAVRLEMPLDGLGGAGAAVLVETGRIKAWNMLPRLEHVYWYRSGRYTVVASRPLLTYVLGTGNDRPVYDPMFVQSLLLAGFPTTESTPFMGVSVLGPGGLVLDSQGLTLVSSDWPEPCSDVDATVDRLTSALVEAVKPIISSTQPVRVALTGGKDSRLVAALLKAAGADFTTFTNGLPEHPDVRVAQQVSTVLGIEHRVQTPSQGSGLAEDLLVRDVLGGPLTTLRVTDGCHSAYEILGAARGRRPSLGFALGGQGGEIIRGGYARSGRLSEATARTRLARLVTRLGGLVPGIERAPVLDALASWCDANVESENAALSLWRFYVTCRTGRWASAGWSGISSSHNPLWPFYDAEAVRAAGALDLFAATDESVAFAVIERLEPSLSLVPLSGARWRFEQHGPRPDDEAGYTARAPVVAASSRGAFNWRHVFGSGLGLVMEEFIHPALSQTPLDQIVDAGAVRQFVRDVVSGESHHGNEPLALWSLYSVALLISDLWLEESFEERRVEFALPDSPAR